MGCVQSPELGVLRDSPSEVGLSCWETCGRFCSPEGVINGSGGNYGLFLAGG